MDATETPLADAEGPGVAPLPDLPLKPPGRRRRYGWIGALLALAALVVIGWFVVRGATVGALAGIADLEGPQTASMHASFRGRSLAAAFPERLIAALDRRASSRLETVRYTIQSGGTLEDIERIYGIPLDDLRTLNPTLDPTAQLAPGAEVVLYKRGVALANDVDPNDTERLYAAVPMPDGAGRTIRRRSRSWGTLTTVRALDRALRAYGRAFPDGPPIIVSDMSRRRGGRLKPHHSHRQGRDVDLSYVPRPELDNGGFLMMDDRVFDVDRNWTFYKALLDTGDVEVILMDTRLQKILYNRARSEGMTDEQLKRLFQYPRDYTEEVGVFRHWDGHRDHTHIRFRCAPDDTDCH